jgi:hypothetical protein
VGTRYGVLIYTSSGSQEARGRSSAQASGPSKIWIKVKNPKAPAATRALSLDAAKVAIRFEKPALTAIGANNTIEKVQYAISDEPMSHEEWVAKFTKGD